MGSNTPVFKTTKVVKKDIVIEDMNKVRRNKLMLAVGILIVILVVLGLIAPRLKYFGAVSIPGLNQQLK